MADMADTQYNAVFEVDEKWRKLTQVDGAALGVRGDVGVDHVLIRLPKKIHETSLDGFGTRVVYINSKGDRDYDVPTVTDRGDHYDLDWVLGATACAAEGNLPFAVSSTLYAEDGKTVVRRCNTAVYSAGAIMDSMTTDGFVGKAAIDDLVAELEDYMRRSAQLEAQCKSAANAANDAASLANKGAQAAGAASTLADIAAASANGAAAKADAAANSAIQIANAVAMGAAGDSDVAELRGMCASLFSLGANLSSAFIYNSGTIYCPSAKASAADATVKFSATCSASGGTISLL